MFNCRISFLLVLSFCFLLGMATRKEVENVREVAEATEVGGLKIELVQKIESVSDYLISKDGKILLYTPKTTGQTRVSDVRMLNIAEDTKTKVLSFKKTRSTVDIDPEVLNASWTELFEDKIIYRDRSASGNVITRNLDGTILSKIPCYYVVWDPVISPRGKYVVVVPSYDADYPSLKVYETETGEKLWEKFTPPDIDKWHEETGQNYNQFYVGASFISDDSLVVCYNGEIYLFNTKTGNNYWKKEIIEDKNAKFSTFWVEEIYLKCSNEGDIIFSFPGMQNENEESGYVYSITNKGNLRWKREREGFLDAIPRVSPFGKYVLFGLGEVGLLDNKKGELVWKFEGDLLGTGRDRNYFAFGDKYLIVNAKVLTENSVQAGEKVYVINSSSGKFIVKLEGNDLCFSNDKKMIMFKNNGNLYIYRVSKENVK